MIKDADISENQLLVGYGEKVCMNLLKDHTTQQNIYWATDSYSDLGDDYTFFAPITLDKITSYVSDDGIVITKEKYKELVKENPEVKEKYQEIIRPRSVKSREEQTQRAKDKAEVFTPAWICNAQNNLIDEAWFGRKEGLFNSPDPNDPHKWINNKEKIIFPEDKTWKDYVVDMRLEITCGEAPYLCNRYDAVSGEYNDDVKHRIGLLDRKLRIVSENTIGEEAFKAIVLHYTNCKENEIKHLEGRDYELADFVICNPDGSYKIAFDVKNMNPDIDHDDKPGELPTKEKRAIKRKRLGCQLITVSMLQLSKEPMGDITEIHGIIDDNGKIIESAIETLKLLID